MSSAPCASKPAEISSNCGQSWTQLYYAEALALGTTTTGSSPWAPTAANQWLLHDIDISAYDGQSVVIRFTGVNDYGDRLYLDNLEVVNNGLRIALKLMLDTGTVVAVVESKRFTLYRVQVDRSG